MYAPARSSTSHMQRPKLTTLRAVFSLLIINKAGGLVYNRKFTAGLNDLSSNDLLIMAGTFHGVHEISRSIAPAPSQPSHIPLSTSSSSTATAGTTIQQNPTTLRASGIEVFESATFRLQCFQTLTRTKFLLLTEPQQPNVEVILRRIHELYADFVMKNPFQTLEMPIRCEKFDRAVDGFVRVRG
ncbi:hypothetical protein W97_01168 [Coniosporium apollinis CBS 100218]|uniref:Trafficking protein particle complex subunit n=1 Tax=Coniosporium apollinis (strain CBS 100218) TaxID=1168221 RepID=R7YJ65_CONA1|nr:uncharacterized protein W97_01168 [Coniosporium apollinis CBS 100218]EON61950.1 hypothetical protein W97_01168 [Coniosporium apollinis CBS 100218]